MKDPLEVGEVGVVHGYISFVDYDREGAEDGSDSAAVVEGGSDDSERGVEDDDAVVGA